MPFNARGVERGQRLLLQLRGQMPQLDFSARGHGGAVFDRVFEFAHIARPVVVHHGAQGVVMDAESCRMPLIDLVEKVCDQHGDIVAAIAQGRQAEIHDVQAVVQILAEGAMFHHCGQIAIGRGKNARFDRNAVRGADRPDLALLKSPQQLGLQVEREFANLVEKDRSTSGRDKEAILGWLAPVKAPFT